MPAATTTPTDPASDDPTDPPPDRYVAVPGGRLRYRDEGDPAADPVVLIHAGIAQLESWDEVAAGLVAHGYRVVRPDLRGWGLSTTEDVEFDARADLVALLDHVGVGRALLVGNSMGGSLAFDLAVEHPERVVGVVGVGAGLSGYGGEDTPEEIALFEQSEALEAADPPDPDAIADFDVRIWVDGPGQPVDRVPQRIRDQVREWDRAINQPRHVMGRRSRLEPPAADRLAHLSCPVLAIAGALDFGYVAGTAHHLAANAPDAQALVWDDVAHMIGMEQPGRLVAEVVRFARRAGAPGQRSTPDPDEFAAAWVAAWNAHDVEAVLAHFADDAVFTSPVAARVVPASGGVLRGKAALRDYWTAALAGLPDLRFEVLGCYAGLDTLVINYRNQRGGLVNEVLTFAGGLVVRGGGTYLAAAAGDVGAMDRPALELVGDRVTLVPVQGAHVPALRAIRQTPEVEGRWGVETYEPPWPFGDPDVVVFSVLVDGVVRGLIQYGEEPEPDYRYASIDLFLDPEVHGQGIGRDAVRTMVRHLVDDLGHRRITIDPAADNAAAIRCYAAAGFRPVGVMRGYERDRDGQGWHDGLLMDLLADDRPAPDGAPRNQ